DSPFIRLTSYTVIVSLKLYLITYDLLLPERYESLAIRLGSLGARQLLDRAWAVRSARTAAELKDELRGFVDDRDRIVVTEVGAEWASRRARTNLGEL
ncbi:MAG TPA: hypothetical protein VN428_18565, partial [Bryobacteraceae bacterium]|nr:hypothetical protein [Bryobacteraceae bacterium]